MREDISSWTDRFTETIASLPNPIIDRVIVLEETLSTQDDAARACAGLGTHHKGALVVASRQTMGRGQRANNWYDGPALTLPCSIAIGKDVLDLDHPNLAARAGLAALDAVRCCAPNTPITIKWPNDIIVRPTPRETKKIAGVLIEHAENSLVIGIGINCLQTDSDWYPSIDQQAISLYEICECDDRAGVCCHLIESLHYWLLEASEDEVKAHWNKHDALVGTQQKLVYNNCPYLGRIERIDPLDSIRIHTTQGEHILPVTQTRVLKKAEY